MRARQHRQVGVGVCQLAQLGDDAVDGRQQNVGACVAQHQRIGKIVDVFAGAGEVHEFLGLGQRRVVADALFDEVLHRLHVVIGGGFDGLDARAVVDVEIRGDALELFNLRGRERRQFHDARIGGQCQQPLDLHMHAAVHQAEFAEDRAQRFHLAGVTAVQRRQGGQGVGGHRGTSRDGKAAILQQALAATARGAFWRRANETGPIVRQLSPDPFHPRNRKDMSQFRTEHDSMGELKVPSKALYGAQTQRAVDNFPISGMHMPRDFIRALGLIKAAAADANFLLGHLKKTQAHAIRKAALTVAAGEHDDQFPIDVFQTGSGTSTNMNANEVIAHLASRSGGKVHPNDHVNYGQSSNDVIPTAIHVSAALTTSERLLPALKHLKRSIEKRSRELRNVAKTGRTHLMDAMPVTFGQELSGWAAQIGTAIERIEDSLKRMYRLPLGGTAVGTGINADPHFGATAARELKRMTGVRFESAINFFEGMSSQDAAVELSGQLKTLAVALMKIANDLRWMNSGPLAGLGEIELPALQPGSSIMPGKVNPVIPEATAMVAAQVIGNDAAITIAGQSGNFQLNVMLPLIAHNLLQSIGILSNVSVLLADKAIAGFKVNTARVKEALDKNPILVTALNPVIGYEKGAATAKQAYKEKRPILDVALETTGLSKSELQKLLDPMTLTRGGIHGSGGGGG